MNLIKWLLLFLPATLLAQERNNELWQISIAFSYGSENSYGNPGFMLTNAVEYKINNAISLSGKLGYFQSVPWFHPPDFYFSFNAVTVGTYLSHTSRFNNNKNFVRISGGPAFFQTHFLVIDSNTETGDSGKFGYGLSLDGGGRVSEKIYLSLLLQIYSYDIFGDIIVLGPNVQFKLCN